MQTLFHVKYNGKTFVFNHLLQFILSCNNFNIDEGVICNVFTITLIGKAKDWCLSLPVASVHSWDEFPYIAGMNFQRFFFMHFKNMITKTCVIS